MTAQVVPPLSKPKLRGSGPSLSPGCLSPGSPVPTGWGRPCSSRKHPTSGPHPASGHGALPCWSPQGARPGHSWQHSPLCPTGAEVGSPECPGEGQSQTPPGVEPRPTDIKPLPPSCPAPPHPTNFLHSHTRALAHACTPPPPPSTPAHRLHPHAHTPGHTHTYPRTHVYTPGPSQTRAWSWVSHTLTGDTSPAPSPEAPRAAQPHWHTRPHGPAPTPGPALPLAPTPPPEQAEIPSPLVPSTAAPAARGHTPQGRLGPSLGQSPPGPCSADLPPSGPGPLGERAGPEPLACTVRTPPPRRSPCSGAPTRGEGAGHPWPG